MSRRAYDYATPSFGGDYCCVPPPSTDRPSTRPDAAYRSLQKQNSILQSSLNRADSSGSSGRGQLSRLDSLSSRSPLTRGNSGTRTETYSTTTSSSTGGGSGVPSTFSTTSYKSPYGNTYRSCSKF